MRILPLIVSYRLQAAGLPADCQPEFTSTAKDPKAHAAAIEKQREAFVAEEYPYFGTFAEVRIFDPTARAEHTFLAPAVEPEEPEKKKKKAKVALPARPIALQLYDYLVDDTGYVTRSAAQAPDASFRFLIGFGIRRFLKILGIECVLYGQPLPLDFWYATSSHKELSRVLVPSEYKVVGLDTPLRCLKLAEYTPFKPHQDCDREVTLALELLSRFGFLNEATALLGRGGDESEAE